MPVRIVHLLSILTMTASTHNTRQQLSATARNNFEKGSFGYDLDFLNKFDSVIVLNGADENAQVIVSPKYQAKVFTSTANGLAGNSFGWINYEAFATPLDAHMNAYGGENRFWLGPEGGKFSLFFSKGDSMTYEHWKTPAPFDTENWEVMATDKHAVSLQKNMDLTNYAGTRLQLLAHRRIQLLNHQEMERTTGVPVTASVNAVGYETLNTVTNTGNNEWNQLTGMPCIWMLDMLSPSPATVIIIPYKTNATGKIATTDYFGEIPSDRIRYANGILLFKADGKSRGKIGLTPERAKPVAGSYDALNKILTLTFFDVDAPAKYLNQEWNTSKPTFSGDAVNAYNDGPLEDGKQMGPFYEIESVSPAAFLKPGESLSHRHAVFHFTGEVPELDKIAVAVLGLSLAAIEKAF